MLSYLLERLWLWIAGLREKSMLLRLTISTADSQLVKRRGRNEGSNIPGA